MKGLFPFQEKACNVIPCILEDRGACILRADEGTGKTHMAAYIAGEFYPKTLWVTKGDQQALKYFKTKVNMAKELCGHPDAEIDVINYNTFGDYNRLTGSELKKYDLLIFDECHKLRNFTTSWTNRFVMNTDRKNHHFLFLSATPAVNTPKDYIYYMNKADVFEDIKKEGGLWAVYERFLGSYKDVIKGREIPIHGTELINKEDFISRLDQIKYDITQEQADDGMPPPIYESHIIEGEYGIAADFTKYTDHRVDAGIKKAPKAAEFIKEDMKKHNVKNAMVLCYYHTTAELVGEKLGLPVALTTKQVQTHIDALKQGQSFVTTMGLTNSNYDVNECNVVYVVESTYSAPLDRQSIRRALRIGKRSTLRVVYISYPEETPLLISLNRGGLFNLDSSVDNFRPSSFARLEQCPGSFWYPAKPIDWVQEHSFFGTQAHAAVERYLRNPNIPVSKFLPEYLPKVIEKCRKLMRTSDRYGIEERVHLDKVHEKCLGSSDFWSLKGDTLTVLDYKNGSATVEADSNFQLLSYATMICHTHDLKPELIQLVICQRGEVREIVYKKDIIPLTTKRIDDMIGKVLEAASEPHKHLKTGECDFFCPVPQHPKEEDRKMGVETKRSARPDAAPRFKVSGKVFWSGSKEVSYKRGKETVEDVVYSYGVNLDELPAWDSITKHFGTDKLVAIQNTLAKSEYEGREQITGFFSAFASSIGEKKLEQVLTGSLVNIEFSFGKEYINKHGEKRVNLGVKKIDTAVDETTSQPDIKESDDGVPTGW